MIKINIKTTKRAELIDITEQVQNAISKIKIEDGICVIYCPHTTAGLTINENADLDVQKDIILAMNKLVPQDAGYAHREGNSDGHIKASLFGSSVTVIIEDGQILLGTWQGIYFAESDGPRSREAWIKVIEG